ncbi:hypothetical protein QJS04_geneDACA024950 [Acorus gramineus]|uniref:Uncharacterized protein n=1 Tax=Acorus gramineus TaxID=55184 RepID=A0AAV9A3B1_ACOGR|nr:hypothetical protein QJS04_geneDACA024950 [Acorus gramineus]
MVPVKESKSVKRAEEREKREPVTLHIVKNNIIGLDKRWHWANQRRETLRFEVEIVLS